MFKRKFLTVVLLSVMILSALTACAKPTPEVIVVEITREVEVTREVALPCVFGEEIEPTLEAIPVETPPSPLDSCIWEAAISCDHTALIECVKAEPNSLDQRNGNGQTPLHLAAAVPCDDNVSLSCLGPIVYLVAKGADVDAQDSDGKTPLHHAGWAGFMRAVDYLYDSDAKIHAIDNFGMTPKDYSIRSVGGEGDLCIRQRDNIVKRLSGESLLVSVIQIAQQDLIEGNVYNDMGLYDKAIESLSKVINGCEGVDECEDIKMLAYWYRGAAYYEIESYSEAVEDFSAAIELNPEDPLLYYNRGRAYFDNGDCASALPDLEEALVLVLATAQVDQPLPDQLSTVMVLVEGMMSECLSGSSDTPTATTMPAPTLAPTPVRSSQIDPIAFVGVTSNDDWSLYIQEFDGMEMALVPAGCFEMGSTSYENEQPVHEQCFDEPFWIDVYEVTNEQYGSYELWSDDDLPRVMVNWSEAVAHCESRGARLPTEAEWEYAARGPDGLVYPWGDEFVSDNVAHVSSRGPLSVGSKPGDMSWVGSFDMSGNVWEWTSSIYRDYPYDATDGREVSGDLDGDSDRVVRGGEGAEASTRGGTDTDAYSNTGFRCARSFTEPTP